MIKLGLVFTIFVTFLSCKVPDNKINNKGKIISSKNYTSDSLLNMPNALFDYNDKIQVDDRIKAITIKFIYAKEATQESKKAAIDFCLFLVDEYSIQFILKPKLEVFENQIAPLYLGILACDRYCIIKTPKDDEFYEFSSILKANLKDYPGAIEDMKIAISLLPTKAKYYSRLANMYALVSNKSEACLNYKKARELGYIDMQSNIDDVCNSAPLKLFL